MADGNRVRRSTSTKSGTAIITRPNWSALIHTTLVRDASWLLSIAKAFTKALFPDPDSPITWDARFASKLLRRSTISVVRGNIRPPGRVDSIWSIHSWEKARIDP